jgi:uncharacterized spore protein YtfJ
MDIESLLAKADANVTAGRAFGPVIERDGRLIIPTAFVVGAGGGGSGEGPEDDPNAGKGGGGGHFSVSWPMGAYVADEHGVRWVPAFDATRVALAGIALAKLAFDVQRHRRARSRRNRSRGNATHPVL